MKMLLTQHLCIMTAQYDTIVVGGGSAGCVIANRLSADAERRVLLLEAGRDDRPGSEPAHIKDTFFVAPYHPDNVWPDLRVNWQPLGAPDAHPRPYIQARVIGGGSSINAMGAIRGLPEDYELWERQGASGWGWTRVLPYFRKLEHDLDFEGELHGNAGPIRIRRLAQDVWPPFTRAVAAALQARDLPLRQDMNGGHGAGVYPFPLHNSAQSRLSAAMAYLPAAVRARPNLTVRGRTLVEQVLIQGTRVTGVRARTMAGTADARAAEVVVTAGTLHTPVLLMRSGIGDAAQLRSRGIEVHADVPGVGANLHDHPFVSIAGYLRGDASQPATLRSPTCIVARRSSQTADAMVCDQFLGVAGKVSWHPFGQRVAAINVVLYGPRSRGRISLAGPPARPTPCIEFNLLQDESDLNRLKEGFRFVHGIMTSAQVRPLLLETFAASFTPRMLRANRRTLRNWLQAAALTAVMDLAGPFRRAILSRLVSPAPALEQLIADDDLLGAWLRRNATGFFHPVGTCRMGAASDPHAVVDPAGRVRGVAGLVVADASVMPTIPRAPTNLTTLMIAEKIADAMAGNTAPAQVYEPIPSAVQH